MAVLPSLLAGACPAAVVGLSELLAQNYSPNTPTGLLSALRDPRNIGTFDRNVGYITESGRSGEHRALRVMYRQRATVASIESTKDCDPATERLPSEDIVTVDLESHHTITVSENEIAKLCDAYQTWVRLGSLRNAPQMGIFAETAMMIVDDLDAMRQDMSNKIWAQIIAGYIGRYQGQAAPTPPATFTPKTFNMLNADSKSVNALGIAQFIQEMTKMGFTGTPFVAGSGNIEYVNTYLRSGLGNDSGVNTGALNPNFDFRLDYAAASAFANPNQVLAFFPGTYQMLSFGHYRNMTLERSVIGTKARWVFPDPVLNFNYDISIEPDECDENYTIKLSAYYDAWRRPLGQFASGDRLAGVNGGVSAIIGAA